MLADPMHGYEWFKDGIARSNFYIVQKVQCHCEIHLYILGKRHWKKSRRFPISSLLHDQNDFLNLKSLWKSAQASMHIEWHFKQNEE